MDLLKSFGNDEYLGIRDYSEEIAHGGLEFLGGFQVDGVAGLNLDEPSVCELLDRRATAAQAYEAILDCPGEENRAAHGRDPLQPAGSDPRAARASR